MSTLTGVFSLIDWIDDTYVHGKSDFNKWQILLSGVRHKYKLLECRSRYM